MFEAEENVESVIFQALSHPMRRTILRIIGSRPEGISYSELIAELNLSTGKLNYHIEQLQGLIERDTNHRYVLTSFGRKALNQLEQLKREVSPEDENFVKMAESSQQSSLQPTLRSFLLLKIAFSFLILFMWGYMAYIAITEGAPIIVYVILPVLFIIGLGLLASLVLALKKTPVWLKRLERRLLGPG